MITTRAEEASTYVYHIHTHKVDTVAVALVRAAGIKAEAGDEATVSDAPGATECDAGAGHSPYVAQ